MGRLFVALPIPTHVSLKIIEMLPKSNSLKYTQPHHHHITILFLGDIDNIENVKSKFETLFYTNFDVSLKGVAGFYKNNKPSILYLKVNKGLDQINSIHQNMKMYFGDLLQNNLLEFTPHLTICRNVDLQQETAQSILDSNFEVELTFKATDIILYDSSNIIETKKYNIISRKNLL